MGSKYRAAATAGTAQVAGLHLSQGCSPLFWWQTEASCPPGTALLCGAVLCASLLEPAKAWPSSPSVILHYFMLFYR